MQAVIVTKSGGPEVLALRDVTTPNPGLGEVRIRIHATAVNRADLLQRRGHYPAPPGVPADILGLEFAGEVDALGEGVTDWSLGDRVFGLAGGGAYADYLCVHGRTLARVPSDLTWPEAAAIPEAFLTAYDALVTQAGLSAGETVLVHAAGSGIGTAAIQIAHAIGAQSIGTSRTREKLDRARALGMTHGIVPIDHQFATGVLNCTRGLGANVILELVGGAYVPEDLRCLAPKGRLMLVGLVGGTDATINLGQLLYKRIQVRGTQLRARPLEEKIALAHCLQNHLVPLFERGLLKPIIDRVLPLSAAAEAHSVMENNEGFGKVVLTTTTPPDCR